LIHVCGDELKKLYYTFTFQAAATEPTLSDILAKFDSHYAGYKNLMYASFVFWGLTQQPQETFEQFLSKLRLKADQCEFGDCRDRNLKDKIIHGIQDSALRELLLRE